MKVLNNKLILYIPLFILMIISLYDMYLYNNIYFIKQLIFYIISILILLIVHKLNINVLLKYSKYYYYISVLLLILVLLFGTNVNGSTAWFNFGVISFQPSEFMKIALALYLPSIHQKNNILYILKVIFITIIPCILVFLEPDTGAIIFYLIILFSNLITKKINKKYFYIMFSIILFILLIFILLYVHNIDLLTNIFGSSVFYRIDRILTFNDNYQLNQALIALGASSILGSISIYIPESITDFIFIKSIANLGIIISIVILICYLLIIIYLINLYYKSKNKLITLEFTLILVFNIIINISFNLGLLPIIGIALPFLSYGGSNLIVYYIFLSIVISLN